MILSFKDQFILPIIKGTKIHTIREDKSNRWKAGNEIHFATGTRTPNYNQFYQDVCVSVQPIILVNHGNHVYCRIHTGVDAYIHNDCVEYENTKWYSGHLTKTGLLGDLCKNDGLSWEDFKNWFVPKEGDKFVGKIIHWTDFRYKAAAIAAAGGGK
jgi:hypothetical protein